MKQKIYKRKRIIPVGWKEIKLGDVFRTSSGSTPLSTEKSYYEGGVIPWINSGELASPYIYKTSNYITQKGFENSSTELYPKDTVLVAMYGATAGKASLLKLEACTNQAICAILPNEDYCPEFIKYNIDTLYEHLVGLSSGSARDNLSQAGLKELKLVLPKTKKEQEKLVSVLSLLDRKIELNRQINDNLEAMAKQLYDYWFVQFDFPNEEGKPYKSSGGAMVWNERLKREIPIDWTCCSIKEMCDINKKTINKDEHKQIEYLDTGSITQGHISNTEIYSVDMAPSRAQRKVEDLSILYSSVRPRLLHYGILSTPKENFIVSTGFVTLDAKCKKMALMVYYFLTSNTITEHLASIADTAVSSYPSISPDDIAYLDIVIPSNDIIQKYNDIVEPMFRKMSTLRKEIDSLTKQRNELLPLLMNGQASVNYHLSDD